MTYRRAAFFAGLILAFAVFRGTAFGESIAPKMILVQGGTFWMGSSEGTYKSTERAYQAELSSFYISEAEITQEIWAKLMGNNPSAFRDNTRPVEMVSWFDAVKFCNALSEHEGLESVYEISGNSVSCDWGANGYRLPTEAEWEYAARGGEKKAAAEGILGKVFYAGGENADEVAWFSANSGKQTKPVKTKAPNELGIFDMSGNVWEWCWDWMGAYPGEPAGNPKGLDAGNIKVLRGGAWFTPVNLCRVTYRFWNDPSFKANSVGFRIARNAGK